MVARTIRMGRGGIRAWWNTSFMFVRGCNRG
nr:MAG TPA: hypothetical protein [Caudoviricetes sp.]